MSDPEDSPRPAEPDEEVEDFGDDDGDDDAYVAGEDEA